MRNNTECCNALVFTIALGPALVSCGADMELLVKNNFKPHWVARPKHVEILRVHREQKGGNKRTNTTLTKEKKEERKLF